MERDHAAKRIAVGILAVLLAAVFLMTGVPKLLGGDVPWLQPAAMEEFPAWVRVVVGLVETIGAVGLLVPAFSALAAIALALLMIPATLTQLVAGQSGAYVPALLFVLLLVLAWARSPGGVRALRRETLEASHPLLREGVVAGVIGATSVALWFLAVDVMAGQPLFTPATLGRGVLSLLGPAPAGESVAVAIVLYTVLHYAAFVAVGLLAAVLTRAAETQPAVLAGVLILFVVFEIAFHGFVALLQETTSLGALAWYQVMAGNLIAAATMGTYLWRAHPALRQQFAHALGGGE